MSQSNRDNKRVARERIAAAQEAQRKQERRRRQWIIGGVAIVVIGAIVGIGVAVSGSNSSSSSSAFASPTGAVVDSYVNDTTHTNKPTAIEYGSASAKVTMTVFEDVRCPFCDIFELGARDIYKKYVDAGEVKVDFHLVKLIDVNDQASGQNASGSRTGGSAVACAQSAGLFDAYHDVIYSNQPPETTDTFSNPTTLINLAKQVPGLDTPTFESCVKNINYGGFVDQNWTDFNTLKLTGTPTVELNGTAMTSAQMFSTTSTAGVTPNTTADGSGANTTEINSLLQAAVTKAYGSATPAPWSGASASASSSAGASTSASATAS
jgi:protein-disulfide isomerase